MGAGVVYFDQMFLLRSGQLWLRTEKSPFRFSNLHAFPRSSTTQIRLELRNHGKNVEEEAPDRIVRVVYGSSDAQFHVLGGELVDDVFRVSQRTRQTVELCDNECVSCSARSESLP